MFSECYCLWQYCYVFTGLLFFFRWLDWVIAQRTTKVDGTEIGRNDLGVTMTTVLEILKQANRPLDKAYAKDIFNVRTLLFN